MPPDDRERVAHMLEGTSTALGFVTGRTREDLETDRLLALALTRLVEIIGEAAKHVSQPARALAPGVRWREICGARDRLAHGYFSVDHDILWNILTRDLPILQPQLEDLLGSLG